MFYSDIEFRHHVYRARPILSKGFGLFAILTVMAVAIGTVLGFAI
jgi:hypothetical protein